MNQDSILNALCLENQQLVATPPRTKLQNHNASPELAPFNSRQPPRASSKLLECFPPKILIDTRFQARIKLVF